MTITLFFSPYCPPATSVLLVAKALNLNPLLKEVDLLSKTYQQSDFKKEHPTKSIPALKDGNSFIWESHAISEYLVNKYGRESDLRPQNFAHKADVDRWLHFDTEHLMPATRKLLIPLLFHKKFLIQDNIKAKVSHIYSKLNVELKKSKWLTGNSPTIADLCCITSINSLDLIVPVDRKCKLYLYMKQFNQLPYYSAETRDGLHKLADILLDRIIASKFNTG